MGEGSEIRCCSVALVSVHQHLAVVLDFQGRFVYSMIGFGAASEREDDCVT